MFNITFVLLNTFLEFFSNSKYFWVADVYVFDENTQDISTMHHKLFEKKPEAALENITLNFAIVLIPSVIIYDFF